jgi:NADPH:quinone reductase-like Zn-dependent oxidoreductase
MRAVVLPEPGAAETLQYQRRSVPQLSGYAGGAAHAARVRVISCAVAFRDILDRTGAFPFMQRPTVLGHEFAGVVESVGEAAAAAGLSAGDRVVSLHWAQQLGWPAPFDSAAAMGTFLGLGCVPLCIMRLAAQCACSNCICA